MPISKPADGTTGWGAAVRAAIGAVNAQNTIYATEPPPGALSPIPTSQTDDAAPALQAQIDALAAAGGGRLVLSRPGTGVRVLSGLDLRTNSKVQLASDENTVLDTSQLGAASTALTVNDQNFTPIVGLRMDGGLFTPSSSPSDTRTGISISGVGLEFDRLHLQYFGRAIDITHDNTFILRFNGGGIGNCVTGIYADLEAGPTNNSGERIVFDGVTFYNSLHGFKANGNGLSMHFVSCSIDFCVEFGAMNNASIFITGSHLETGGNGAGAYLFDLTGNGHLYISDTPIILGGGRSGGLYAICRYDRGPANYGYGSARLSNVSCYFVDPNGNPKNRFSRDLIPWESGVTTKSIYVPWPIRWSQVTARFCSTDGYTIVNDDTIRITAMDVTNGQITLTSSAAYAGQRWVEVQY